MSILPQLRAVGTYAASTGPIEPGLPEGTAVGDLLIMLGESRADQPVLTAAGWLQYKTVVAAASRPRLTVLYRIATGTDPTLTNDTGVRQSARIVGIKAGTFDPISPFNASGAGSEDAAPNLEIPGLTTTVPNTLVIAAAAVINSAETVEPIASNWANASLVSITEIADNIGEVGVTFRGICAAAGVKAAAGVVATTTATATTNLGSAVLAVAIAPAPESFALTLEDSIALSDSLGKGTTKAQSDSLALSDQLAKAAAHAEADSLALSDAVAKSVGHVEADTISLSDSLAKQAGKALSDAVSLADGLVRGVGKWIADVLGLSDSAVVTRPVHPAHLELSARAKTAVSLDATPKTNVALSARA